MALVTWLALFPQVVILSLLIPSALPMPIPVALLIAVAVKMLTWPVMPRLSGLLHVWLYALELFECHERTTVMIEIRKSAERGHAQHGWLESYHSFSFADYYDPRFIGFRALRVINEDRVQPGQGFPTHSHRDMEIISYVLEGALEHRDSLGNGSVIRPGEVQRMSAGRGITHSEFNSSRTEILHFLQIWILPEHPGIAPSYEQKSIDLSAARGKFHPIVSRQGGPGEVTLYQDAIISVAILEPGEKLLHGLARRRAAWLQVARGAVSLNDYVLTAGDGAAIDPDTELNLKANRTAEILLLDLA